MDFVSNWDFKELGKDDEEDFVEYHVYLNIFDSPLSLEKVKEELLEFFRPFLSQYIWQKDSFSLLIWKPQQTLKKKHPLYDAPPHLFYKLKFGECIEDEWFTFFLLLQLTKNEIIQRKYQPVIQIQDNDGEFLLIEAAFQLPKWLSKPKHAINRIFLYKGNLQIVPRRIFVDDPSSFGVQQDAAFYNHVSFPSIQEAVVYVRENDGETKATQDVQIKIRERIQKYSEALELLQQGKVDSLQEQHFAVAYLPDTIAALLKNPLLLSRAIQHLYSPDLGIKLKKNAKTITSLSLCSLCPVSRNTNVWMRIRFSRWLYAQINFFTLPTANGKENKETLLGLKLEFAVTALHNYYSILGKKKYIIKFYHIPFLENPSWALNKRTELPADDNDSWLTVTPDEMDDLLTKKKVEMDYNANKKKDNPGQEMNDLMRKFSSFMDRSSGLEGVECTSDSDSEKDFYSDNEEEDEEMINVMKQMDEELGCKQNLASDFETVNTDGTDIVDENLNFMRQLLSSLEEQPGTSHALTNILEMISNPRQ